MESWTSIVFSKCLQQQLTVIRKQYDKLAFLLHPDKNSLPGAEAAFSLVSEAHIILSDHTKRSLYDIKRQYASKVSKKAIVVFWTICPHCQKRFMCYQRNFLVFCGACRKIFFAFKLHEEAFPSRILFPAPNDSQDLSGTISCQEHGVPSRKVQHNKLHVTGENFDSGPTMHATQSGDQEVSSSETRSEVIQFIAMSQTNPPAPSVDKGSTGSVPDSFDPYFVSIQDLSTEDASTVPNAEDSFSLERLGKKNQDDVNNSHSRGSCNSKWDYDSIIFDADPSDSKMLHDSASSADNQSAEHHQIILDSQEDATATPEEIQQG